MTLEGAEHDLNLIAAYVEDRLPAEVRERVTAHLASCSECRTVVAELLRAGVPIARLEHPWRWRKMAVGLSLAATVVISVGAGLMVYVRQDASQPAAPSSRPSIESAPGLSAPGAAPEDRRPPAAATPQAAPPVTRAAGERTIDGKRFRLVAGEWIDTEYDPFALLATVTIRSIDDRDRVLGDVPALRPYLELGPRFTVVHQGTVYRFELPASDR